MKVYHFRTCSYGLLVLFSFILDTSMTDDGASVGWLAYAHLSKAADAEKHHAKCD